VLVAQCFTHIPALKALAPTQSEPPFVVAQFIILTAFIVIGVFALKTWRFAEPHSVDYSRATPSVSVRHGIV
jgi:hypothetical protein